MKKLLLNLISCKLNNGLACYIGQHQNPSRTTEICLSVKVGSAYERPGCTGWSHFLEHLSIYPMLVSENQVVQKLPFFGSFDHAFTSFYETAYFFKGTDSTQVLLREGLATAKGILCGSFLTKGGFLQTKEEVLSEYYAYEEKAWYSLCVETMKKMNVTMPVGYKEDIGKAEYNTLLDFHSQYYHTGNAAMIVVSPYDFLTVIHEMEEIFMGNKVTDSLRTQIERRPSVHLGRKRGERIEPFVLFAWFPRLVLPVLDTIQNYVLMAAIARALEAALEETEQIEIAECNIDIFNQEHYIFRIRIFFEKRKASLYSLPEILKCLTFTPHLFDITKEVMWQQLHEQYLGSRDAMQPENMVNCCREHFLFGEPIIHLEDEFSISCNYLQKLAYDLLLEKFEWIVKQLISTNHNSYGGLR